MQEQMNALALYRNRIQGTDAQHGGDFGGSILGGAILGGFEEGLMRGGNMMNQSTSAL
jgi:hypothetical protein